MHTQSDRILTLMARKMGRAATEEELDELETLLSSHPEYHFLAETIASIKGDDQHVGASQDQGELLAEGWEDLAGKLANIPNAGSHSKGKIIALGRKRLIRNISWAGAAALAAVIFTGILLLFSRREENRIAKIHEVVTPLGQRSKIMLPDGTKVWLNAGSRLSYRDMDGTDTREVFLKGEAYFDVKKDAVHPFIVHAASISIKVLGTTFNVKAYPGDKKIETTLLSGKIEVQINNDPEKRILLSPHEKLTVVNNESSTAARALTEPLKHNELKYQVMELAQNPKDSILIPEAAWVENKLVFVNEPFSSVAEKMDRWYNVHIHFEDAALKTERLSGVFEKEDIRQALNILQLTTGFKYKVKRQDIYLTVN